VNLDFLFVLTTSKTVRLVLVTELYLRTDFNYLYLYLHLNYLYLYV